MTIMVMSSNRGVTRGNRQLYLQEEFSEQLGRLCEKRD